MNDGIGWVLAGSVCIILAFIGFGWSANERVQDARGNFEQRCDKKGGKTLQAYKGGREWLGCYKIEEWENE